MASSYKIANTAAAYQPPHRDSSRNTSLHGDLKPHATYCDTEPRETLQHHWTPLHHVMFLGATKSVIALTTKHCKVSLGTLRTLGTLGTLGTLHLAA